MKKHMKKLMAAVMALAMILSLSVTAFADTDPNNLGSGTSASDVGTEGGLPTDLTDLVLPVVGTNTFEVIFDSYGLLAETKASRFDSLNNNEGVTLDGTTFFFKNVIDTVTDVTAKLAVATGEADTDLPVDTVVTVYKKLASTNGDVKIYAKYNTDGKFEKWLDSAGTAIADIAAAPTVTISSTATPVLKDLKELDPKSGYGLDAIDKINEAYPFLYFRATGADTSGKTGDLKDTVEYVFNNAYDNTSSDFRYVYFKDGTPGKVFSDLGSGTTKPTEVTGTVANLRAPDNATADDANGVTAIFKDAKLTIGSDVFYRQQVNRAITSLSKTSKPVKVVNKTNAPVGVTMKVELTNIPGGTGEKNGDAWTYVYAKDYDAATGKFYDALQTESTAKEIVGGNDGVPVMYMALEGGGEKEVMTYSATDTAGVMSISVALEGGGYGDDPANDLFLKIWNPNHDNGANNARGGYEYQLANEGTREKDFHSMTFTINGAIDAENDAWTTLGTGTSAPKMNVTWSMDKIERLSAPSLTAATFRAKAAWVFTSDKNPASAALKKVTFNYVNADTTTSSQTLKASEVTYVNNTKTKTETFTIPATFMTANTAKPASVVFTFCDAAKPYRTVDVTVTSY